MGEIILLNVQKKCYVAVFLKLFFSSFVAGNYSDAKYMCGMKTKEKEQKTKKSSVAQSDEKKKSAFALFWEKYPNGAGEIIDMRAVLQ
jgi:hypothetical protein